MFLHNRTDLDEMIDHRSQYSQLKQLLNSICTKGPLTPTKHYLNQVEQNENENKQQNYWKTEFYTWFC